MADGFFLGGVVDAAGERSDDVSYEGSDLTTHGVIVGMTGSGKTGLGVIFLEEALLSGIPTLILDPKGDMTNLLLTFPDLAPSDFEPWIDETQAKKDGKTVAEAAAGTAELWKSGLESWGISGSRIAELRDQAGFTIYTPGSTAGVPVNIVGSLAAPTALDWDDDAETLRDEIQGFVSGLLGLVGIDADPISSREHILLSNVIEHSWRAGRDLDMASLLAQVQAPPMRKLGVFELDDFFPQDDRMELAMKLNGLIASPAFASWTEGPPLDVQSLLWDEQGRPRAAIMYLAHLSDEERQFIVTLLLSKVVTWMRTQAGSGELRALVYMDEVYGFAPPTAEPPAKRPILTLLKQARAFGVGMLLSTQNPVDLDYKAMSNAGTWCIGRLQTERDKARIVEALQSATGEADVAALDDAISGLDKRQFMLHSTRESAPTMFTTRWAMSYLAGPLTRSQIGDLMEDQAPEAIAAGGQAATSAAEPASAPTALADDETPVMPEVADGTPVYFLDPAAPWAAEVGSDPTSKRLQAAVAARVQLLYDDTPAKINHKEEWEAIFMPLSQPFDAGAGIAADYDDRDFRKEAPADAVYVLPDAKIDTKTYFSSATTAIKNHLHGEMTVEVFRNPTLKLYSRVGESREEFFQRCDREAQDRADAETAKLRDKYETKIRSTEEKIRTAERRVEELEVDLQGRRQNEMLDQAGAVLGMLMGKRSRRSLGSLGRSRSATRSKQQRLASAQDKVDDYLLDLQELDAELAEDVAEIDEKWDEVAGEIEPVEIGLEKTDITVQEIALVWVPV